MADDAGVDVVPVSELVTHIGVGDKVLARADFPCRLLGPRAHSPSLPRDHHAAGSTTPRPPPLAADLDAAT